MAERFVFPDRSVDAWMPSAFTPVQMSDDERGNEFCGDPIESAIIRPENGAIDPAPGTVGFTRSAA